MDQRDDRERKLQAQDDLAENQQVGGATFTVVSGADDSRDNGNEAGDQAAQPGAEANIEEAFHDDLSRQGAGQS